MKRRIEEPTAKEGLPQHQLQRTPHTALNGVAATSVVQASYGTAQTIKGTSNSGEVGSLQPFSYTMPSITSIKPQTPTLPVGGAPHGGILVQPHIRQQNKVSSSTPLSGSGGGGGTGVGGGVTTVAACMTAAAATGGGGGGTGGATSGNQQQFQRLKVEDALSYLDQVKYKFNNQPQVYNDFLEIMKEFKSQCIDTPGVIARVSNLFKGYPELISGFNTFLPPGYKIEVQANDTGYSLQVSVSNPLGPAMPEMQQTSQVSASVTTTQSSQLQQPGVVVSNQTKPPPTVYGRQLESSGGGGHGVPTSNSKPGVGVVERGASGGASALQVLGSSGGGGQPSSQPNHHQSTSQPVEFNHAINYVNKIKNRFQGQPEKYKKFLEILHTYQKEQKTVKVNNNVYLNKSNETSGGGAGLGGKHLTEAEVYSQVAELFENHEDLLLEFGQFLPDATSQNSLNLANFSNKMPERNKTTPGGGKYHHHSGSSGGGGGGGGGGTSVNSKSSPPGAATKPSLGGSGGGATKRSSTELYSNSNSLGGGGGPQVKRQKMQSPASSPHLSSSSSLANHTYNEQFMQLKKCLKNNTSYEQLLRSVHLYNNEVISRVELVQLLIPLLARHPDQMAWLRDTLGVSGDLLPTSPVTETAPPPPPPLPVSASLPPSHHHTLISHHQPSHSTSHSLHGPTVSSHLNEQSHNDIDYTTCKRIGASYIALPKTVQPPRCSGRTTLCRQVLNDTWASFPLWSEEATFVTCRKTQYEEYIYRCEDERFELDLVIECNSATIRILDGIQKKMSRMSPEELAKFRLDDTLGGTSPTIHQRAIKRIYGEKAPDIIEGLKKSPGVSVPVVLKRLKAKDLEWRQSQKGFNKVWREQNEKYYLKSLDHQGINFKQNDLKALRSKLLYGEIEAAYEERGDEGGGSKNGGPHMVLTYPDRGSLDDAANLLIHHVKRQTGIHKEDKTRIKQLLRHHLPDMFHHRRGELSDDEQDSDEKVEIENGSGNSTPTSNVKKDICLSNGPVGKDEVKEEDVKLELEEKEPPDYSSPDDEYTLFYGNNNWYLFLRLHHILCERLAKMAEKSAKIAEEEAAYSQHRKESTAVALRLKPNEHCQDCYGTMLEMVKSVLDCSLDPASYEDTLRNMFGIHAYVGFTLDRVVTNAVRQLQALVSEESCCEIWELYNKMKVGGGAGGMAPTMDSRSHEEAAYHKFATSSLAGDNCYKIYIYKKDCKLTFELVDTESEEEENKPSEEGKWSQMDSHSTLSVQDRERWGKAVFLKRNINKWMRTSKERQRKREKDKSDGKSDDDDYLKLPGDHNANCPFKSPDLLIFFHKDKYLYRAKCLKRAKEIHGKVCRGKYERLRRWHEAWARNHVKGAAEEGTRSWMMGRTEGMRPGLVTTETLENPLTRPPYRPYYRYRVFSK